MRSLCDGFLWIGLRIGVRGKEEQGLQVRAHEMGVAGRAGYVYRWLSPSVPDLFYLLSYPYFLPIHTQEVLNISFEHISIHRISAVMASSGRTTAVAGGTGTQSTPANNVGGETRRVRLLLSLLAIFYSISKPS